MLDCKFNATKLDRSRPSLQVYIYIYIYILSTPLEQTLIIYIVCMIFFFFLFQIFLLTKIKKKTNKTRYIKVLKARTGVSMYALDDLVWLLSVIVLHASVADVTDNY